MTTDTTEHPIDPAALDAFITQWDGVEGSERANYQLFLTQLCTLLALPQPNPATRDPQRDRYVFERAVDIYSPDGSATTGFIDLYRAECFVLEAKQSGKALDTPGWDKAMVKAYHQADRYIRALPASEGRPPFIVVVDVGRSIELYSEFSGSGGTYVPFPDPSQYRIRLAQLRDPEIQQRLRGLWLHPHKLDPSQYAAKVTRAISRTLAQLARELEDQGYPVPRVARFLMRCLFTLFAEDIELIPKGGFSALLMDLQRHPEHFVDAISALWQTMNTGGYDGHLRQRLRRFNGGLFADIDPIPLTAAQIQRLIEAGQADWRLVEPAIFGTLLERALDPRERHKLGAHYTPRAYVERLVMPTVIDPLRREWTAVQVAAQTWLQQDKPAKAIDELEDFHRQLCSLRILDPACGSGNFLYVTLEHLKRLEGEVLNRLHELGQRQGVLEMQGLTVDPQQFLGIELNPRAAAIAEMVLWIGFLQWHYRINQHIDLPEPILRDCHNIENRDALLDYDTPQPLRDEHGQPQTRWDGLSMRISPLTGQAIPDESKQVPVLHYPNPRQTTWPQADYIVGNPPFMGEKRLRASLGVGYVDTLRQTFKGLVPESADFVMYWWHIAAEKARTGQARRFGLITTNSIRQVNNRKVLELHIKDSKKPLSLLFAIPDHPWVDSTDGAAVRIAMTVGESGAGIGTRLQIVTEASSEEDDSKNITFTKQEGLIFADLNIGAALVEAVALKANQRCVFQGVKLVGDGFLVTPEQRIKWLEICPEWKNFMPQLIAGADINGRRIPRYSIDFYGFDAEKAQTVFAPGFQKILDTVKPFRDQSNHETTRRNYWVYGAARPGMRAALKELNRYVATSEVSKHRFFVFLDVATTLADGSLAVVTLENALFLGVLSSRLHVCWAMSQGGRMGMGNDSRWQNGSCFLNFPFPDTPPELATRIAELAERIDHHRKRQLAEHPTLTLTGMYNVLEQLRAGDTLSAKDKTIHEQGLVSLLREWHDELDRAVFAAYGWEDLAAALVGRPGATTPLLDKPAEQSEAEEDLLCRLVALNQQRSAEETQGHIRWLRPEYQAPETIQTGADLTTVDDGELPTVTAAVQQHTWPKTPREQVELMRDLLTTTPQTLDQLAAQFKRKPTKAIQQQLDALVAIGLVTESSEQPGVWRWG